MSLLGWRAVKPGKASSSSPEESVSVVAAGVVAAGCAAGTAAFGNGCAAATVTGAGCEAGGVVPCTDAGVVGAGVDDTAAVGVADSFFATGAIAGWTVLTVGAGALEMVTGF
jgi:hypothetical protein